MDPLTALIIKLNDIERKLDHLQEALNDLKKTECDSIDTENLISEEVHWCIKIFKKFFCYA